MDYLFYYSGKIPNYVNDCFKSIKKIDLSSNIHLCTDDLSELENVRSVPKNSVESFYTTEIRNMTSKDENSLWLSSLLRIFYILNMAKKNNISKFVHFDTDVVIYKSYKELEPYFNQSRFNITPLNDQLLIFGYSYIGNLEIYENICKSVFEIITNQKKYEKQFLSNQKMNEMAALNIAYKLNPEYFKLLPILPNENSTIIFDPASYGQFLGGVDKKLFSKKFTTKNHFIGKKIEEKLIYPKFDKFGPFVEQNNIRYELANLHIHKKNLKKFIN